MSDYSIVMILFCFGIAIAMRMGWLMATDYWNARFTKELREEAAEYFRKEYYDLFVQKFEERFAARIAEVEAAIAEELKNEKEKNDESISSS